MPRFFISPSEINSDRMTVTLTGDNAHHIAYSLRMRAGDRISLCDQTMDYSAEITAFTEDSVTVGILSSSPVQNEPPYIVHLYQALPKGDKLDTVIQKAVECGVASVTPFVSSRCIVREKPDAEARKTERRARIAAEAAKQCGRGLIPAVHPTVSFEQMLACVQTADRILFCYEGADTSPLPLAIAPLKQKACRDRAPEIAVVVGSEGGFSPEEAITAQSAGCTLVGLGPRILRTETAAPFVLGCLVYALELDRSV